LIGLDVSTQDPILVMRRILDDDNGEWAETVSFMDPWSGHRESLLLVRPTERRGLAEGLAGVSDAGRDLFVATTNDQGVKFSVERANPIDGRRFVLNGVVVFEHKGKDARRSEHPCD
jgi:hypothetical protein